MEAESKIRLMHVVWRLALAGTEYNVIKLVNRLDRNRFIPSIATLDIPFGEAKTQVAGDVEVFELSKGHGFQPMLIWQMAKLFRQQRIDVIHSHNWTTFLYAVLAARLASVPVILHGEHGRDTEQYEQDWKKLMVRRYLASLCTQLTAVSSDIAQILQDIWKVPEWKISMTPNGVMLDIFKPANDRRNTKRALGIAEHAPTIGTVIGTIRPVKDLPTLFKAFKLVRRQVPSVRLLVVGHSRSMQQWEDLAREMEIFEAVHFLGKRTDIPQIMSALDVYVNSSLYEGMSNTILEAMACGVPVIATAVGGTIAIVTDEVNGLLVPPRAPEPMSEAICRLLADENKRRVFARAGRLYVERNHCIEETVRQYETLYLDLAHEKLRPRQARQPKNVIKTLWGSACNTVGILKWRGKVGRRPIFIINYHRVLPAHQIPHYLFTPMAMSIPVFTRQMDFFRRRCRVISLEECVHILENDLPIPEHAVVLTFDDGYRDLYKIVKPILEKYKLPATVFLPTRLIDENKPIWFDAIGRRLLMADLQSLTLGDYISEELAVTMQRLRNLSPGERNLLARTAVQQIARLPQDLHAAVVSDLMALEVETNGVLDHALLTWKMVKEMQTTGLFSFGSHSASHARLDLLPEADLEKEIGESKKLAGEKLDHPVEFFSYPWGCYNDLVVSKVRQSGYRCALAVADTPNFARADLFRLKRVDAGFLTLDASFHEGTMVAELAGLNRLWRSLSRVSDPAAEQRLR